MGQYTEESEVLSVDEVMESRRDRDWFSCGGAGKLMRGSRS